MSMKRIGMVLAIALVLLLAFAWFDGGQEPIHQIRQPVALPENLQ